MLDKYRYSPKLLHKQLGFSKKDHSGVKNPLLTRRKDVTGDITCFEE